MPPMSREDLDRYDREVMGIYTPPVSYQPQPSPPVFDAEGRPITRSASFDDIRRFLGFGNRAAPAPSVDAAEMYQQLRPASTFPVPPGGEAPSPSIPYMPSTDPRGAAAPIPAPPRPAAPARPRVPMPPPPAPTSAADMESVATGLPIPLGGGEVRPVPMAPQVLPGEASAVPLRLNPQQLARAIQRYGRMEMDPNSFAARYRRTQTGG